MGEVADALAGPMVDRIGNRCRCADVAQLAKTFDASRIHPVILLGHQDDLELVDVAALRWGPL